MSTMALGNTGGKMRKVKPCEKCVSTLNLLKQEISRVFEASYLHKDLCPTWNCVFNID